MLWKSSGSAEEPKKPIEDGRLGHGGIEPHLGISRKTGNELGAAVLRGLDGHAPEPRGSGRGGAAAGMAAARRTTTISAALDIASTQPVSLD